MIATLEKVFQMASKFSEDEQELLAAHWLNEISSSNFIEMLKDEKKWDKTFSKSQDELEMLAEQALKEINQGKAEEIDWDKL